MQFSQWLENQEYITPEWKPNGVIFRWIMPGYQIDPRHKSYKKEGEFGSLELEPDAQNPGFLRVVGADIDTNLQKQGYGEALYRYALNAVKQKGYKGIVSDRPGRSPAANHLWNTLGGRTDGVFDYLD